MDYAERSHALPSLATAGNRIIRLETGQPVLLRGVNRSGLEYSEPSDDGFLAAAQFTEDEVRHIVLDWRCTVLRIPFNQDWALRGRRGHSAQEYLAALDQAISWAAVLGAYTILDLQWLDADTVFGYTRDADGRPSPNHVAPTPNPETPLLWRTLAERYRDEPAVLFDLFNEPHDRLPDDPNPIHVLREAATTAAVWNDWAELLTAEVRDAGFNGLVLVGGADWAFDLTGISVSGPNVVYSTHIYSNRDRSRWRRALGRAADVPVVVGEWGGTESAEDLAFGRELADRMRGTVAGWTAWSWVDYPQLIRQPRAPNFTPTAFGELVRAELRG